jgi:transcriptional regulator with XRE-family HTH domain
MSKIDVRFVLENIRKLRERDYISQEYIASKMGLSQNAYSKIELGQTKITLDRLFCIADVLGVDIAELVKPPKIKKVE